MIRVVRVTHKVITMEPDGEFLFTRSRAYAVVERVAEVYDEEEAEAVLLARFRNPHPGDEDARFELHK